MISIIIIEFQGRGNNGIYRNQSQRKYKNSNKNFYNTKRVSIDISFHIF